MLHSILLTASLALGVDEKRPNVLFLFADDQRRDTIAALGNRHIRTPRLDSLAREGFQFARAYCMGSIHGAVCQPSRAMLMSGRTLYRVPMDLDGVTTLPQLFREAGYSTFGTGKWHNGRASFERSFELGRSVMFHGMSNHEAVPRSHLKEDRSFTEEVRGPGFSTELFTDAALTFLREHDGERPFFCYVSYSAPHDPRQPPEPYLSEYRENLPPLPANFMPQHPFQNGWMTGRDEVLAPWPRPAAMIREQLAEYYGMIAHMDGQIGRLLDVLEERGMRDETIVVFTADHGLAVGSHGLLGKQNLYEHSMGTPLLVTGPGFPPGRSEALVYLHDLLPTLCAAVEIDVPGGVEGLDLGPVVRGERRGVRETLFTTYEDVQRAVTDGPWKLIHYPKIAYTQLFHLTEDPDELRDLASDPARREQVERLLRELEQWQHRTEDPHPLHVDFPEPREVDLGGRARRPDRHQPAWIVEKYFPGSASSEGAR